MTDSSGAWMNIGVPGWILKVLGCAYGSKLNITNQIVMYHCTQRHRCTFYHINMFRSQSYVQKETNGFGLKNTKSHVTGRRDKRDISSQKQLPNILPFNHKDRY